MINYVNLADLIKLSNNEKISRSYVKYLCDFEFDKQYRHHEIENIEHLLSCLKIDSNYLDGFLYSYCLPQLSKEFDLLKITKDFVINIELKTTNTESKILKQLDQNAYYLRILNKKLLQFVFIDDEKKLLYYDKKKLKESSFKFLNNILINNRKGLKLNLDKEYDVSNILVSPLFETNKFINDDYILTENQRNIKKDLFNALKYADLFYGITGNAGTGKTLLMYDIAKDLAMKHFVLLVHYGALVYGHELMMEQYPNLKIVSYLDFKRSDMKKYDYILIDEFHRFDAYNVVNVLKTNKKKCIVSFDDYQKLDGKEDNYISSLCGHNVFKLTSRIRTNKEIVHFINCLFDLRKINYDFNYKFHNVNIIYEPDKKKAIVKARALESFKCTYISYDNILGVIGREFDNVCMIIDDNFYYEDGRLKANIRPNDNYLYTKLLYQGLTRVRKKITLIITEAKILSYVLKILR